ncbi:hypothetical protein A1A1_17655 [Planococcus antarcticus DSM 14505]|uniref:Sporulation protein n=1 Tax=Planococcus antarcticus DSM 14505 TaxID=1185653 RepID=A0A1C7DH61_9BACL|nr:hypothetical protein [Planococcus antarcticus]ANU10805.1 hypothetical protein BBH88_11030 [Planococcus antarcticus DSM 14505]EIM05128.1 hypothetical protein A1A1_17655 [Planococcus antarcticus DSM 14505]
MKKTVLLLVLSLFMSSQTLANVTNEKPANSMIAVSKVQPVIALINVSAKCRAQESLLPAEIAEWPSSRSFKTSSVESGIKQQEPVIQVTVIKTQFEVPKVEAEQKVAKANLDEEAGQVNWETAIIVMCIAFLVYLINRKKRQDIE